MTEPLQPVSESALSFPVEGAECLSILHRPAEPSGDCGVLVVVGGPQYRVGSHRQFVELARHLATGGIPVMRFDYRGMGDSAGIFRDFENVAQDFSAAIEHFLSACPAVRRVVVWGLCDAASAACFHSHADRRIAGLVLVNPWVRTSQGQARAYLKHYYLQRLMSRAFWQRVRSGEFRALESIRDLFGKLGAVLLRRATPADGAPDIQQRPRQAVGSSDSRPLPERMLSGLQKFEGPILLVLSGKDLTADEFRDQVNASRAWRKRLSRQNVTRRDFPTANHTFSKQVWKQSLAELTLEWVRRL